MKIEQQPEFQPITITLETKEEAIQEERNKAVTMLVLVKERLEKAQLRFAQVVGLEE